MKNAHAPFESLGIKDLVPPIAAHPEAPLSSLLPQARSALTYALASAEQDAPLRVFFSICDGKTRARVVHVDGPDSETIWCRFDEWRSAWPEPDPQVRWLRIDWVTRTWNLTWEQCQLAIRSSKRNYFRYGIALDPDFRQAFLEQELNANAMLYLGKDRHEGGLNAKNTQIYGQRRFGRGFHLPEAPTDPVRLFATDAFLLQPDRPPVPLHGFSGGTEGRDTGRRQVDPLDAATVENMVDQSSRFLAAQVDPEGQFVYGVHPCFDREIKSYNTLRHASTVYAMLEAWQVTRDAGLKAAIDRALRLLTEGLIRQYTVPGGERVAYLLDVNNEVKLGGSAVCLLALVTYTELTGDERHLPLLEQLAQGIALMQDPDSGQLSHVLHAEDLSVKERFRIIYYDGEAAFGLMRLYGLTKDPRWLALVEKAFDYFIAQEHWRTNDHWLGYCVNELTLYRPEERYFRFGLQNVATHLDFVIDRITTFPTLLELMMAAHKMILRLEQSEAHRHLLKHLDRDKFYRALETRARYMLNGFFWPETAMYFRNPQRILGSFFIRHHAFRVRIDDVEHYLSGFVAYLRHYLHREVAPTLPSPAPAPARDLPRPADAVLACGGAVNLSRRQHMRTAQLGAQNVLDIPELRAADLAVVNLDCVVSTLGKQGTDKGEDGPFYCRARPELLRVLTAAGVDAVTVANAHSGDYGPTALQQQHEILDALGIASTGSGADRQDAFNPVVCRAGDMRVALLSVDTTQHRFAAGDDGFGTAYLSPTDPRAWRRVMAERIAAARNEADIVLVAVHWAARSTPTRDSDIRTLSHALVDVGADGVLGTTGPHLHGIELYHGKPIIHGTGSLLSDTPRAWFRPGGLFRLGLCKTGITWVEYVPVGIGDGFSQRLDGEAATRAIDSFDGACQALGTTLTRTAEQAFVQLAPSAPRSVSTAAPAIRPSDRYRHDLLARYTPDSALGQAGFVPGDARIAPVTLNGLQLLGMRVKPPVITGRQMLWIETWWSSPKPVPEDLRLGVLAIPLGSRHAAEWGKGTDHDPCDWMQPTTRWQPGAIYYDHCGLRPPALEHIAPGALQLELRVLGRRPNTECYLFPRPIPVQLPA